MHNAKWWLEGYKVPWHWAVEQRNCVLWIDGAPSNTSGMSWSGVCDPELITQYHLTNALVAECNQTLTANVPTSSVKSAAKATP